MGTPRGGALNRIMTMLMGAGCGHRAVRPRPMEQEPPGEPSPGGEVAPDDATGARGSVMGLPRPDPHTVGRVGTPRRRRRGTTMARSVKLKVGPAQVLGPTVGVFLVSPESPAGYLGDGVRHVVEIRDVPDYIPDVEVRMMFSTSADFTGLGTGDAQGVVVYALAELLAGRISR